MSSISVVITYESFLKTKNSAEMFRQNFRAKYVAPRRLSYGKAHSERVDPFCVVIIRCTTAIVLCMSHVHHWYSCGCHHTTFHRYAVNSYRLYHAKVLSGKTSGLNFFLPREDFHMLKLHEYK